MIGLEKRPWYSIPNNVIRVSFSIWWTPYGRCNVAVVAVTRREQCDQMLELRVVQLSLKVAKKV